MRPIEASYHNYSILTKPQQCCRRVKEALYQSWDADRNAGGKKDEGIIFVLRRHPQYPEVLEVIDSEDKTVAYRKISRGGRSWRETFHDAARSSQQGRQNSEAIGCGSSSRTPVANNQISPASMCRTGSFVGTACWSMDSSTSQIRQLPPPLHAVEQQLQQLHLKSESLVSTSVATVSSGSWQQCQPEHPRAFDAGELWEITSPCPSSFPLHCRDARGVIGPIPLTAMVLDRHQFCYRFHLAGNKMRWLAKRQGQSMAGLQCYVRGTVVALLLFGGCSAEGTGPDLVSSTGRRESWCEVQHTEDSHLPRIVVLPEAFSKLEPIDSAVVESFVLFTGIEVLECFLYNTDMV
ncbi:hypothetical protein LPJ59_004202 [Coemansia sp. RSA 2399]|nr:hypothetical protein LPJ59_004202 [Coemansia sp. RSA 2399]